MSNTSTLSPEQVLLLENLTYITPPNQKPLAETTAYNGMTVGEYLDTIDVSQYEATKDYGSYMNGEDWTNMINAIRSDSTLCNMTIRDTHVDTAENGGGGASILFTNDNGEAVFAYRGTSSQEWCDNFIGGGPTSAADGVSTPQQENALDWYQDMYDQYNLDDYYVTVTGHSKGGNKAKYITILDDSVDRCLSYDGQGFSDEFYSYYEDLIRERQGVIDNYNLDYDFVNILLNDVGERHYCQGYGIGSFAENHCPNSFFTYDENGVAHITPGSQAEEMAMLDDFLNSYLRTLPPEAKADCLDFIGTLVEGAFNKESKDYFVDLLFDDNNSLQASYLIAYLVKYQKENPEFADAISNVMNEFGLGEFTNIVDGVAEFLNWKYSDEILAAISAAGSHLPDWVIEKVGDFLKDKLGFELSNEQIKKLLRMIAITEAMVDNYEVPDGSDMQVSNSNWFEHFENLFIDMISNIIIHAGNHTFMVEPTKLRSGGRGIEECANTLLTYQNAFTPVGELGRSQDKINAFLSSLSNNVIAQSDNCYTLAQAAYDISERYMQAEQNIINS